MGEIFIPGRVPSPGLLCCCRTRPWSIIYYRRTPGYFQSGIFDKNYPRLP